jgi:VWFA-related protein
MSKFFIAILLFILTAVFAFAQEAQNTASLNLIAMDKSDNFIGDLQKEDLSLVIDGKPQAIVSLEKTELPLIYALAVDSSGSMRLIFEDIIAGAQEVVNQNKSDDETMLVSFISSDKIRATNGFSADKNALRGVIDKFYVEGGQTALIDAVYLAITKVAAHKKSDGKNYRRGVLVITDGEDRDSGYSEQQLFELIRKENVQVFFIGLTDRTPNASNSLRNKSKSFMKRVAEESGGAVIFPDKTKDIPEKASQILPLMRTQYRIIYTPAAGEKSESPKIEVNLSKESKRKDVKFYFRRNKAEK